MRFQNIMNIGATTEVATEVKHQQPVAHTWEGDGISDGIHKLKILASTTVKPVIYGHSFWPVTSFVRTLLKPSVFENT